MDLRSIAYPAFWRPLMYLLRRLGVEFDQRMGQAWEMCSSKFVTDVQLLTALVKLGARGLECLPDNWLSKAYSIGNFPPSWDLCHPEYAEIAARSTFPIWIRALELAGTSKVLTCRNFCQGLSDSLLNPWDGPVADTPPILSFLGEFHGECLETHEPSFWGDAIPRALEKMPRTRLVISALGHLPAEPDDFQYALCVEKGNIVFRAFSVLGDFAVRSSDGAVTGNRGLLTHLKEQLGIFTADEIAELEEMIRHPKASEKDFQKYFEAHPHFFRRWDYREVYSQVCLTRNEEGSLIPDFILTNPEIQEATIVELKLPKPKLVRRQENRERFADAVLEARSQLLEYRDWFEDKGNREKLVGKVNMEIFRPRLAVVIGRSTDFRCAIDRQKLASRTSDIDVVTYDDVVACARRRLVSIGAS
ncbi:MAG TPA: Shedu anti-phage system protein SduA domain-containing protein [Candidatus Binatia bacterium]|nr:MAG: hypothetical protein A2Z25_09000 [Planctomycetes bacterium RBG_16_55_9]HJX09708.1 Shedu anti-phage system protein SduA domain-containing protein [Candidatus Binatia bacterium]